MTNSNEGNDPKDHADVPPVLPNEQPTASDAGGVLSPDELDFTESPHVAEVSDGRYVVSADKSPPSVPKRKEEPTTTQNAGGSPARPTRSQESAPEPDPEPAETSPAPQKGAMRSPEAARSLLASELERTEARYAMDIVSRLDGSTVRHRTTSDDVVGTFDSLVLWYAQHVAKNTGTQRTASLLLEKSEFSPVVSPEAVRRAAKENGLSRSSTIGDLLDALE
ncbi:DUF7500 family protein [Halopiger goleimassiliensis]|uniref:DUF7500 family protein n=1 Tax=Halopiger goleimassiliensis TaxID=1293048 RepID=UPI000677B9F9|nr:hypothetical protein [Halopiger goleimassiliensis]